MSKWFRMAAAIAMLGLVMACLTPAAAVVPTATNAPVPVAAATARTGPAANNGKNGTLLTPTEGSHKNGERDGNCPIGPTDHVWSGIFWTRPARAVRVGEG